MSTYQTAYPKSNSYGFSIDPTKTADESGGMYPSVPTPSPSAPPATEDPAFAGLYPNLGNNFYTDDNLIIQIHFILLINFNLYILLL